MVVSSTSGLRDWLVQRLSAVILLAYTIFFLYFLIAHSPLDYMTWHGLFRCVPMKIATLLCLAALLMHAWVGVWTIGTDYIKIFWARFLFQTAVFLMLAACFLDGLFILWGV